MMSGSDHIGPISGQDELKHLYTINGGVKSQSRETPGTEVFSMNVSRPNAFKKAETNLVEIFRTDVEEEAKAVTIVGRLRILFPLYRFNFDLEDCDRILRVESSSTRVDANSILRIVKELNVDITLIVD